ncbi:TRAPPC9 [Mytilus coruscus]|uniref:TRAPPC9 n=1 Tax=Mytilus coruscus TaxID=42192 RepID=A0A6J8BWE0_MYTCO|nr:TRAPPC9 [Mytilus coruscus]
MNRDGSPLSEEDKRKFLKSGKTSPVHSEDSGVTSDLSPTEVCGEVDCTKDNKMQNDPEMSGRPHSNSLTKESTGAEVVFFPCIDECPDLEEKLKEFVSSIFFVLDGKRLTGHLKELIECSLFVLHLRKKTMLVWILIQTCFEGLCSASVILVYPRVKNPTLRRVESMSIKPGSSMGKETKIRAGVLKHNYTTNGLQELADPVVKTALNPADIIDKYRECILNYSKFKLAAVIELEACLKACRFLIQQRVSFDVHVQKLKLSHLRVYLERYCTMDYQSFYSTPYRPQRVSSSSSPYLYDGLASTPERPVFLSPSTLLQSANRPGFNTSPLYTGFQSPLGYSPSYLSPLHQHQPLDLSNSIEKLKPNRISAFSSPNDSLYLQRLKSNPMFQDLQTLLVQECLHMQVPTNLINTSWNSTSLKVPGIVDNGATVYSLHLKLQERLLSLRTDPTVTSKALELEADYSCEVGKIEVSRYQGLCSAGTSESARQKVNSTCDEKRLGLIKEVHRHVDTLVRRLNANDSGLCAVVNSPGSRCSSRSGSDRCSPDIPSQDSGILSDESLPEFPSTNKTESGHIFSQKPATSIDNSNASVNFSAVRHLQFNKQTVSDWITSPENIIPVTSPDSTHQGISSTVIIQRETTKNGSLHMDLNNLKECRSNLKCLSDRKSFDGQNNNVDTSPEGISKAQNLKEKVQDNHDIEKKSPKNQKDSKNRLLTPEATIVLTNWYDAHLRYPYPSDLEVKQLSDDSGLSEKQVKKWMANKRVRCFNTLSISGNQHPIKLKYKGKGKQQQNENARPNYQQLTIEARDILNQWYEGHHYDPYPLDEEKEELAEKCGISVGQIRSWFANKRSRANNTRKQIPNYFIEKFPEYTPHVHMKLLQAADFLQNVVYINIQSTDEDKIDRYCTLSQLYSQLGFLRKAAFFRRIAAMQCVTPQNPRPNWQQCYHLMMQSLEGYKLIFDIKDIPDVPTYGWPIVQYRVLNELIYSAKRMGNIPLAIRHSTFLLQTLHKHLSCPEKSEIVSSLESLTARCEGTTQALALDNGVILPPLPLTEIPHVRSFRLVPAAPHLEPVKIVSKSASAEKDLFIYTPLSIGSNSTPEKTNKVDFRWVAKDLCEVHLQVFNPMPEELKITQMGLLIEGVEMEMYPSNPVIPAESGPYLVKMLCRPKSHGELNILGYTTLVYGVHSNCRLKDIPHLHETQSKVEIIPPLPNVQVKSSFPQSAMFITESDGANVVTTASASLYAGQSEECLITVHNTSVQPVERVQVKLRCKSEEKMYFSKIFNWCSDNIESQLPIQSSKKMCFSVCVSGHSDFLLSSFSKHSSTSAGSEVSENTSAVIKDTVVHKCFETTLQIQYSGGEGLKSGFCRICSIAFTVDILPSVIFVNWDVLPAESPDHCVLVFDVKNVSGHQIEVQYTTDQNVILELEEVRRVSVQVERCIFPPEPEPSVDLKNTVIKHIGHSNHYSQFLASFVDIRWNIPSETCCGKASIEHLKWTNEQLELISVSRVSWDIRINDEMYTDTCNPEVLVGRLMLLDVNLTLKEDLEASEGELEVSCCSKVNCEIDSMCTLMGTDSLLVPNVDVSSALKFSTSFLFHVSGHYTLDVKFTVRRTNTESIVFKCYKILLIVDEEDR